MSDDGGYGGGGDDFDYESGAGCVTKKTKFPILLIMLFSTSDLMMEHLCVSLFVLSKLRILS